MVSGLKHIGPGIHQQGADGMAAPQSLGQSEGVRLNAESFIAPELAAAAHAHLHFIQDQQDVAFAAEGPKTLEKSDIPW